MAIGGGRSDSSRQIGHALQPGRGYDMAGARPPIGRIVLSAGVVHKVVSFEYKMTEDMAAYILTKEQTKAKFIKCRQNYDFSSIIVWGGVRKNAPAVPLGAPIRTVRKSTLLY